MELTAVAAQTVAANQNVLYTNVAVSGNASMVHRSGSGIVTLRGLTNQCRARFRITFGGNIAVPTGGTAGAIQLSAAINEETVPSTTMITTPAAVAQHNNVSTALYVDVPKGCCAQISIKNTSAVDILVQNANLIVERVA